MELLVLQVLDPVAKRAVDSPTPSSIYLFPRLLDRCISVVIEYVLLTRFGLTYLRLNGSCFSAEASSSCDEALG